MMAGSSPASARMSPQGSMIRLCPNDTRFDVEYNTVDVLVGASYNF